MSHAACSGGEALDEAGLVRHAPEPGFNQGGELGDVSFGEVGQGPLEVRLGGLDRGELGGVRPELEGRRSASAGPR
jgi:hypothetical protein